MTNHEKPLHEMALEWPYPVNYDKESTRSADVLVIGGGLAGCHAAISAANRGAKVVVLDKAPVIRSGSAGAGIDHWHDVCTCPCCKVTPEEIMEVTTNPSGRAGGYASGNCLAA